MSCSPTLAMWHRAVHIGFESFESEKSPVTQLNSTRLHGLALPVPIREHMPGEPCGRVQGCYGVGKETIAAGCKEQLWKRFTEHLKECLQDCRKGDYNDM